VADYPSLYRTPEGRLRVPFASIGMFLQYQGVRLPPEAFRAVENLTKFVFSAAIMCRRLKGYLDAYQPDNWSHVPIDELFLDTQSFFLFVQQYLEDVTIVVRLTHRNLPSNFSKMVVRLRETVLKDGDPLKAFLAAEGPAFGHLKDLRDDILHRTTFDRNRKQFPHFADVFAAGSGRPTFPGSADLRSYVGAVLVRLFALSALMDTFVRKAITERQVPITQELRTAISGDGLLFTHEERPLTGGLTVGTHALFVPPALFGALENFLQAGEHLLATTPVNESV
jgi:hypothetical protein